MKVAIRDGHTLGQAKRPLRGEITSLAYIALSLSS
jgi:hypothetical protein